MEILSVSLSEEEVATVKRLAEDHNTSRSQVIKDALARYSFDLKWQRLHEWGDQISKSLGLESDDEVEEYLNAV